MFKMRLTRYAGVSTIVGSANLAIATGLTYLGMHYMWATFWGLLFHSFAAFFWLRREVFNRPDLHALSGVTRALIVESGGLGIVMFVTYLCVDKLGFYYLAGRLVSIGFVVVWDYVMHSSFTFKTRPFN